MTVVIGVLTVAVVRVGVVTVTVVIGVLTATVTGVVGIGRVGRETVGSRSVVGDCGGAVSAVDEGTDAGVAAPPEPRVDARGALALRASAVLE